MATGRALKTELVTDTRDFERGFDRAAREVKDFADEVERRGREARDSMRRNMDDLGDETGDTMRDTGAAIGDEFAENIGEGFRSGDIGGTIVETMTSLVGQLKGPMGQFLAIGGGIVTAVVYGFQQRQNELREIGLAAGQTIADAMSEGLTAGELRGAVVDIVSEAGGEGSLATLSDDLAKAGSSMDEYVAAVAAGGDELKAYDAFLLQVIRRNTDMITVNGRTRSRTNDVATAAQALRRGLHEQSGAYDDARAEARAYRDAVDGAKGSNDDAGRRIDATADKLARQARRFARARREAARYSDYLAGRGITGVGDAGTPLRPDLLPGRRPWRKPRGHRRGR